MIARNYVKNCSGAKTYNTMTYLSEKVSTSERMSLLIGGKYFTFNPTHTRREVL